MRLLPVEDAIQRLGIKRAKLCELLMSRELPSLTIGRRRLIPDSEIDAFIQRKLQEAMDEIETDGDTR